MRLRPAFPALAGVQGYTEVSQSALIPTLFAMTERVTAAVDRLASAFTTPYRHPPAAYES
jgi:hypothetical protein